MSSTTCYSRSCFTTLASTVDSWRNHTVSLLKTLSSFGVAILLLSVLAISFHHHGDLADHPACPLCKTAQALSDTVKPSPPVLPSQICKAFHDLAAGEHPAVSALPATAHPETWPVPEAENCRRFPVPQLAASRASPATTLSLNSLV
jgi:hypothetical protein